MPGFKDVLEAIQTCRTAAQVQRACRIPPSRLLRILRSPRFRRYVELDREFTEFRGRREAHKHACLAADTLASALAGHCEREVRLAAGKVMRLALGETRREPPPVPAPSPLEPHPAAQTAIKTAPKHVGNRAEGVKNPSESIENPSETRRKVIAK